MTLIIGMRCKDGVVMGADSAATFGTRVGPTIRQPVKKLSTIAGRMIVGVSGFVGLAQRICCTLEKLNDEKKLSKVNNGTRYLKPSELGDLIRRQLWEDSIGVEMQVASLAGQLIGPQAQGPAIASTLLAIPACGMPALIEFEHQAAPTVIGEGTPPFCAIGSGQPIADPFLAFVRKIFFPDSLPSLELGLFATVWALDHAIEVNPGGVAGPVHVSVLKQKGTDCVVEDRTAEDLEETSQAIADAENCLRDYKRFACPVTTTTTPPPTPKPTADDAPLG